MPAKAKLVTRTATSTSVSTDNLNKGSELTHIEADSNFINLRDQTIGFASDDSTTTNIQAGDTLYVKGGTGITTAVSGDTITITNAGATGDITFDGNTISTGSSNANLELATSGTGTIELLANTNVAGNLISSTGYLATADIRIEDNTIKSLSSGADLELSANSAGMVSIDDSLKFKGSSTNINEFSTDTTLAGDSDNAVPTEAAVKTYVDAQDAAVASDSLTFTNKTIDANGTGNNISNIDIANMTAASVVLEAEGIASNDNDTTLPTSAAVKDYADSKAVLTGSTNNTIATVTGAHALNGEANLTFDGSTLAVTGAATVSTTLGVTGASTLDGVTITDNTISTNASNANLEITANGSGLVQLGAGTDGSSAGAHNVGNLLIHEVSSSGGTRHYANGRTLNADLTGDTSSGLTRFRIQDTITLDMAGNDSTSSGTTRGAQMQHLVELKNSSSDASVLAASSGQGTGLYIRSGGSGNLTVNDFYSIRSFGLADSTMAGTTVVTDYYHFFVDDFNKGSSGNVTVSNEYAFYDNGNLTSRFGAVEYANQSGDPSTVADTCHVYAKDVSSSSKLFFRDEAGNVTQFSPHNEQDEWIFHSTNTRTGKTVRVNMEKMIRKLEEFTGETFIETE